MSVSRRVQRVERELREIISTYLLSGFKYPLIGIITLTRVEVSADLRSAKVFLSMMANEEEKQTNLKNLQDCAKDCQQVIHQKLPMKYCPKIFFILDKGFDNAQIVEQRLREIKQGSQD